MGDEERPDIRPQYDFSSGVQGKYAARFKQGTNLVSLDQDIAEMFPDSQSVNKALRPLADIIRARLAEAETDL